jgi:hypothetical protein
MNKNDIDAVRNSFRNFNKWETYGLCYNALESGEVSLSDIVIIAWNEARIPPTVSETRMRDFEKMGE